MENGHYANFSTVLGLIEVKDCSVGNEECGQLVNAVAIAYEKQHEKRPIWGFVIGPKDTTNFVCCCVESGFLFFFFLNISFGYFFYLFEN